MDMIVETTVATNPEMEALRASVRAVMTDEKRSMQQIAREADVAASTFSAWMSDKYGGDNERVAEGVKRWLRSREVKARMQATRREKPKFIMTPTAQGLIEALAHAQHMADFIVMTSSPGIGKTTACRRYRDDNPAVWMVTGEPCVTSPRVVMKMLAEALDISETGSTHDRSRAVVRKLRDCGGLIIIDDAQHLGSSALDQLRTVHDLSGVGVALVGNEGVYRNLEGGHRSVHFAQLFSRVGVRLHKPKPLKGDIDMLLDAWGISGKPEREFCHLIGRKPGALRSLTKALQMAFMLAAADEKTGVDLEHINMAWKRLDPTSGVDEKGARS